MSEKKIVTFFNCYDSGAGMLAFEPKPGVLLFQTHVGAFECEAQLIPRGEVREIESVTRDDALEYQCSIGYLLFVSVGLLSEVYWHPSQLSECFRAFVKNWSSVIPKSERRLLFTVASSQQESKQIGAELPDSFSGPMFQGDLSDSFSGPMFQVDPLSRLPPMYTITLCDPHTYEALPAVHPIGTQDFSRAMMAARSVLVNHEVETPLAVACIKGAEYRTYYRVIDGVLTAIDRKRIAEDAN